MTLSRLEYLEREVTRLRAENTSLTRARDFAMKSWARAVKRVGVLSTELGEARDREFDESRTVARPVINVRSAR